MTMLGDETFEYLNSFGDANGLAEALLNTCMAWLDEPALKPLIARAIVGSGEYSQRLKAALPSPEKKAPPKKKGGKGPKSRSPSSTKWPFKKKSFWDKEGK